MGKISVLLRRTLIVTGAMVFSLVMIETGLRLAGYLMIRAHQREVSRRLTSKDDIRIVCFGDSTTAYGSKGDIWGDFSYPAKLEEILNRTLPGKKFTVINMGIPGASTDYILHDLEEHLYLYRPSIVVTMMGVNDHVFSRDIEVSARLVGLRRFLGSLKISRLLNIFSYNMDIPSLPETEPVSPPGPEVSREEKGGIDILIRTIHDEEGDTSVMEKKVMDFLDRTSDLGMICSMAQMLIEKSRFSDAEALAKRGISIYPKDPFLNMILGWSYLRRKAYGPAEEVFLKVKEMAPLYRESYTSLIMLYIETGEKEKIESLFGEIEASPVKGQYMYGLLAVRYLEKGMQERASQFFDMAEYLRERVSGKFMEKYRKMRDIVTGRGMVMVAVSYPMRRSRDLEKGLFPGKGVLFVDNSSAFRKRVTEKGYDAIFMDNIGGDFGHCMEEGNGLIAQNVASVIIEGCFKEEPRSSSADRPSGK